MIPLFKGQANVPSGLALFADNVDCQAEEQL
jgi:hypothetical protein